MGHYRQGGIRLAVINPRTPTIPPTPMTMEYEEVMADVEQRRQRLRDALNKSRKPRPKTTLEALLAEANGTTDRRKPRHEEEDMQRAIVRWFRYQYPNHLLVHCPNGGARSKKEGAIFKAAGVTAGFPDLFLYAPKTITTADHSPYCETIHGLAIELKTDKGKQSPEQKAIQAQLEAQGYRYLVIRSFDEAVTAIKEYLA